MKKYLYFLFILYCFALSAQENYYSSPVRIPILLSGSFGELRNNHFHSGIDIKTQQKTGYPIYAVAEGHVSRIVVSPSGFGKALYIDHPNGTTSVYGHLENFRTDISKYIKDIQYKKESFRVDEILTEDRFKVVRDEVIARSGNSGSSGGPHLHFEIRDTKSEEPLNPLQYKFPVNDNIAPRIYSIMITPLNDYSHVAFQPSKKVFPVTTINGKYQLQETGTIPVYGNVGIAVEANDFFDGSANRCGIFSLKMWFDGELYSSIRMDRFSFDESRYINSYIDYGEYVTSGRKYQKTWIEPGNKLGIYENTQRGGNLKVTDGNFHPVKIELKDLYGNTSVIEFTIAGRYSKIPRPETKFTKFIRYDSPDEYRTNTLRIEFPKEALYNDLKFMHSVIPVNNHVFSDIHIIHDETTPLHNSLLISIKAQNLNEKIQNKALLVKIDTISGKYSYAGGIYEKGWVTGHIRNFGSYAISADTILPTIVPLSFKANGELNESSVIRFRIEDELSGIKSYKGILDGKWALFEFDIKTNTIVHFFDAERFEFGKRHHLKLIVTDFKDNIVTHEASFWK